jgi:hypothetical protein
MFSAPDPSDRFSCTSCLYWFWFYFSWTTAYLALSYSITVQEQERHAAELTVKAQEAQVSALRYQINPHFLFNTLNAIAALIRDAPARAEEMVVQLSDFFRRSLAINPMEDLTLAARGGPAAPLPGDRAHALSRTAALRRCARRRQRRGECRHCCCSRWSRMR